MNQLWEDNYLAHFGIKGQKWGIRRFQNLDGTLTPEGKARYRKIAGAFPELEEVSVKNGKRINLIEECAKNKKLLEETKQFEKMSSEEKKTFGDKILKAEDNYKYYRDWINEDGDLEKDMASIGRWIGKQVAEKSGTDTQIGSKTEANRQIREKIAKNSEEMNARNEVIKKEIGYAWPAPPKGGLFYTSKVAQKHFEKIRAENKRLHEALTKDSIWSSLNEKNKKLQSDWQGIVLRDIGFRDTPENRAIIWPYIIEMWD